MRWKRGCQSLNSSLLSYSYPYEKQLITVNHVVSMVTSTDFGLLYYHILSLHQHYNMNIRILYNRTVLLVSPQSKHGNQPKTWDGSVAFQPNLHQVPASRIIKRPGAGWNGTRVQVLWRFSQSSDWKSARLGMFSFQLFTATSV